MTLEFRCRAAAPDGKHRCRAAASAAPQCLKAGTGTQLQQVPRRRVGRCCKVNRSSCFVPRAQGATDALSSFYRTRVRGLAPAVTEAARWGCYQDPAAPSAAF